MIEPIKGPAIGIQAYFQLLCPFCFIGRRAWAIRGPKSRAGLMAYPVVPPNESPMAQTKKATGKAPNEPSPIGVCAVPSSAFVK